VQEANANWTRLGTALSEAGKSLETIRFDYGQQAARVSELLRRADTIKRQLGVK